MNLYNAAGRPVALGRELARGGEGLVYAIDGQAGLVAKIYAPAPREGHEEKLSWMLAHPPRDPGYTSTGASHQSIAWPRDLLYDIQHHFLGYVMPYVRDAVPILLVFNPRSRARTLPGFDRRYLHRTARNLAGAFAALHEGSYIAGDLNESNVLVTSSALVTLIDTDSFQVQEPRNGRIIVYPCPVGKAEYTAPELQGRALGEVLRQPQHDDFALAVLVFQLLMEGNHPFRARWLGTGDPPPLEERIRRGFFPYDAGSSGVVSPPPGVPSLATLGPEVSALVRRCFRDGYDQPAQRPTAREWDLALEKAEQALVDCANGHVYAAHLPSCPLCGAGPARSGALRRPGIPAGARPARPAPVLPAARPASGGRAAPPPLSGAPAGRAAGGGPSSSGAWDFEAWLMRMAQQLLWSQTTGRSPGRASGQAPASPAATPSAHIWRLFMQAMSALAGQPTPASMASPAGQPSSLGVTCPRCGVISSGYEIYCQGCGAQLAADRRCARCGRTIPGNSRYCPHCAARLS